MMCVSALLLRRLQLLRTFCVELCLCAGRKCQHLHRRLVCVRSLDFLRRDVGPRTMLLAMLSTSMFHHEVCHSFESSVLWSDFASDR